MEIRFPFLTRFLLSLCLVAGVAAVVGGRTTPELMMIRPPSLNGIYLSSSLD